MMAAGGRVFGDAFRVERIRFATLTQGWKRQLRRMFGALDSPIARLVRVRIGPVWLGDLTSGRARALKAPEVRTLGTSTLVTHDGRGQSRSVPSGPPRRHPGWKRAGGARGSKGE